MSQFYGTMYANHRKTKATTRGHKTGISDNNLEMTSSNGLKSAVFEDRR